MYPLSFWNRLWFCLEAVVTTKLNTPDHWTFTNTEQGKKSGIYRFAQFCGISLCLMKGMSEGVSAMLCQEPFLTIENK